MAAYAALVSLMHLIEQIQHHPRPPISLDRLQVESLSRSVAFLQDFLENYPHDGSKETDELESRIARAAHAAEDAIESHIVHQHVSGGISSTGLRLDLQKVTQDMDFIINKEVMHVKEKTAIQNNQLIKNPVFGGSVIPPSTWQNSMVGFDDLLYQVMDRLTAAQRNRQIIPIYGMGGIGKTTLARNTFRHETIMQHFDILAWVTISQEYSVREILLEILCQENREGRKHLSENSEYELGEIIYKRLSGRRYLIVMDDTWVLDVWDKVNRFFPNNNSGSRILVTTRLSNVALQLNTSNGVEVKFLDEDQSWNLLCKVVFEEEGCPFELEQIGKAIARNCKGLPLSIVVIGRVLAKSRLTKEYWEHIAENLSSIINLEDNEHCFKVLSASYNHLPAHLKPCFLYMGVFKEDRVVHVSLLIKLWVAEGFLKPVSKKSLEVVAEEYLKDLIDRNLIFIHSLGADGNIRSFKIHDLLRDLCLRQARKEEFIYVASQHSSESEQGLSTRRCTVVHQNATRQALRSLQSMSLLRSLSWDFDEGIPSLDYRLLRVLNVIDTKQYDVDERVFHSLDDIFSHLINLRYLAITIINYCPRGSQLLPSSLYLVWNVHTLIIDHFGNFIAPSEIWKMYHLRHVEFQSLELPDPPSEGEDAFVLGNLQTLLKIKDFKCCEQAVKRIPHIKLLQVKYTGSEGWSFSCFDKNLNRLTALESLSCFFLPQRGTNWSDLLQNLTFPHFLKNLCLKGCHLQWEDVTTKIGCLPLLQVLRLEFGSTKGRKWETVEGRFPRLMLLKIESFDLECWTSESTHFPFLEHLILVGLEKLEKIPHELGNVSTLKLIDLTWCNYSAILSAKEILDEQDDLGNVELHARVRLIEGNEQLESFKSRNFQVKVVRRN